ncbi:MAG: bifunctional folylpolyglutamate synthase/dihydrofolate synthase, partial [Pseudomonadota bacterium]|nr:bifunctional folylpolyglutamate synthase/dihydrofolate synthase [Pseudomonadota bacterium]
RPTRAVFSALADKDAVGIVRVLCQRISHWYLCGLREQTPRGTSAAELLQRLRQELPDLSASAHSTPQNALAAACSAAEGNERVLVFGSFYLIAALLPALEQP